MCFSFFRVAFNSLCAHASVNHLHWHLYHLRHEMLLEYIVSNVALNNDLFSTVYNALLDARFRLRMFAVMYVVYIYW